MKISIRGIIAVLFCLLAITACQQYVLLPLPGSGGSDSTPYDAGTAEDFSDMLSTEGQVRLTKDIAIAELPISEGGDYVIDLNGKELSSATASSLAIPANASLTIKGGTFSTVLSEGEPYEANIVISESATLRLSDVDYKGNCAGIGPNKNSSLYISGGSVIETEGAYTIATNATADASGTPLNGNITISITDSTVKSIDGMAICFNVPGTVTIRNSIIEGCWQAVMIRGGNATIEGSTISATCDYSDGAAYESMNWGSGNRVPFAALVAGNRTANSYKYPTVCTVDNKTTISMVYTGTNPNTKTYNVYIASSNGEDGKVVVTLPDKYEAEIMSEGGYWLQNPDTDLLYLNKTQLTVNPD